MLVVYVKGYRCVFKCFPAEAPKLAHETFRAIKPGLSAYADDPEKVQLLVSLLDDISATLSTCCF